MPDEPKYFDEEMETLSPESFNGVQETALLKQLRGELKLKYVQAS